jgi:protocatechuate 4,5-dioxygenase beta chain
MPLGLGLASSHAPTVWRPVDKWPQIYAFLAPGAPEPPDSPETLQQQYAGIQASIRTLREQIESYRPDAIIIVGDDQNEVFSKAFIPSMAMYIGDPISGTANINLLGEPQDENHITLKCDPSLAKTVLTGLVERGFDVASMEELAPMGRPKSGLGHAFSHLSYGIGLHELGIPIVVFFLNAYHPPLPTARRCYDLGQAMRQILANRPERVAIIGSGGLMHNPRGVPNGWIDETLDHWVLDTLANGNGEALTNLFTFDASILRGGTGEIRSWITVAGAFHCLPASIVDYVPVKHGCTGLGFAYWKAD